MFNNLFTLTFSGSKYRASFSLFHQPCPVHAQLDLSIKPEPGCFILTPVLPPTEALMTWLSSCLTSSGPQPGSVVSYTTRAHPSSSFFFTLVTFASIAISCPHLPFSTPHLPHLPKSNLNTQQYFRILSPAEVTTSPCRQSLFQMPRHSWPAIYMFIISSLWHRSRWQVKAISKLPSCPLLPSPAAPTPDFLAFSNSILLSRFHRGIETCQLFSFLISKTYASVAHLVGLFYLSKVCKGISLMFPPSLISSISFFCIPTFCLPGFCLHFANILPMINSYCSTQTCFNSISWHPCTDAVDHSILSGILFSP